MYYKYVLCAFGNPFARDKKYKYTNSFIIAVLYFAIYSFMYDDVDISKRT